MLNLDKNKRYLLACSFGPDSMALFSMLLKENIKFDVALVNYHLREESNFEQTSLESICKANHIKIYVHDFRNHLTSNIEANCRAVRYSFFSYIFGFNKYEAVLVAHNKDDLIETYLLQKKRKNLPIFYGINEKTIINGITVLRPLLNYSKRDLKSYCDENHIPYSIDKTNLEPMYERNKIRLDIVSNLSEKEKNQLIDEIDDKNKVLKELFKSFEKQSNLISDLNNLSDIEFAYYLNWLSKKLYPSFKITYKQSIEIRAVMNSKKPNSFVLLNKNSLICYKENDRMFIKENVSNNSYRFTIDSPVLIDNEILYINLLTDMSKRNIHDSDYPLTIRTYEKDDSYQIKNYSVPVRRLFIDWKMPTRIRKIWPLVINNKGKIIYIPRYRDDFVPDENCNFYVKECFTLK